MVDSDHWIPLSEYRGSKRGDYTGLRASLSIEYGPEYAEVIRDVVATNPHITGITRPVEVKPGVYIVMTSTPVRGSAGFREIYHVNGQVRKVHDSLDLPHRPRMKGSKLEFDVHEVQKPKPFPYPQEAPKVVTKSKRVWGALIWDYL